MGAAAALEDWLREPGLRRGLREAAGGARRKTRPTRRCWRRGCIPDPRKVRLRVYQTNSTHKSMSAIRQGSMVLVQGRGLRTRREPVPRGGLHPRLDQPEPAAHRLPRRGAAADGARGLRPGHERDRDRARRSAQAVNSHPLISKYFRVLGADEHDPGRVPRSRASSTTSRPARNWGDVVKAHARGRVLPRPDAHDAGLRHGRLRRHAVQGPAGRPSTTSSSTRPRATRVLLQSNINNTRSDVAHLIRVLVEICREIEAAPARGRRGRAGGVRGAREDR